MPTLSPEADKHQSVPITTLFQPIVSVQDKSVIGFEALSRDSSEKNGTTECFSLFNETEDTTSNTRIDLVCAGKALKSFQKFYKTHSDLLLFINLSGTCLDQAGASYDVLLNQVEEYEFQPGNIVFEVPAEHANLPGTAEFLAKCREKNFKISLDNVGITSGILELLLSVQPDFIKLGREIWSNPADDVFNVSNIKLVIRTCLERGCTPIALGIEDEDEALYLLLCNLFHQQGFHYTRKRDGQKSGDKMEGFQECIARVYARFVKYQKETLKQRRATYETLRTLSDRTAASMSNRVEPVFDPLLRKLVEKSEHVISAFVLDNKGIQVTLRAVDKRYRSQSGGTLHSMVRKGSNHSLQNYCLHLGVGYERYVTTSYISQYTHKSACLIANRFLLGNNDPYILCVEYTLE